ncbi:hypothetical protein BDZ91DRAFT_725664, partial [Kalaharituber pfeilii]
MQNFEREGGGRERERPYWNGRVLVEFLKWDILFCVCLFIYFLFCHYFHAVTSRVYHVLT